MDAGNLKEGIRSIASELGFSSVGFASAGLVPQELLEEWLARGYHGEMQYLSRNREKRLDPRRLAEGTHTILSLALDYYYEFDLPYGDPQVGVVSRYARSTDYHLVIERKLKDLLAGIHRLEPSVQGRYYVDTGPLLEKHWAQKAGLGWIGKHTNLISRRGGSWFFLAEILLNIELEPDPPAADHCGTCTRCIEACPTEAIVEPYVLDARRCISYLTIELRSDIPETLREPIGNLIFGCDICQDVCPWNRKPVASRVEAFRPAISDNDLELSRLAQLTPEGFAALFRRNPVKRTKWRGLMRNVAVAMGNSGRESFVPFLQEMAAADDQMVRRHAVWALSQITQSR